MSSLRLTELDAYKEEGFATGNPRYVNKTASLGSRPTALHSSCISSATMGRNSRAVTCSTNPFESPTDQRLPLLQEYYSESVEPH